MVARDAELMDAVCDVARLYDVPVYGMAGTCHEEVCRARDVPFVAELYVDLPYRADGSLVIPRRPGRTPPELAAERARRGLTAGTVQAVTGEELPIRVDSICVHSDTPNAPEVAAAVLDVLRSVAPADVAPS
jgi:UPF0271 protein